MQSYGFNYYPYSDESQLKKKKKLHPFIIPQALDLEMQLLKSQHFQNWASIPYLPPSL